MVIIRYILGVDIGTSSLKAVLLDEYCNVAAECGVEYSYAALADGGVEQNSNDWIDAFSQALEMLREDHSLDLHDIEAVCPTGMYRSLLLTDERGVPLRDAIIWSDIRCAPQVDDAVSRHGQKIWEITRTRLTTACTLPRFLWLKEHEPEIWEKTRFFMFPSNYIAFYLTGEIAMDKNTASHSSLYDVVKHDWSGELTELFGLEAKKCPKLIESLQIHGHITPKAAQTTGLKVGVPVIAGCGDAAAEAYSVGMETSDICKIRLGSAGDICSVITRDELFRQKSDSIIEYVLPERYIDSNYILTCAQAVKWARGMFWRELVGAPGSYSIMDMEARAVAPGSEGLMFHPYLLGENSPYYNPDLRAMFHGFKLSHERRHVLRAVYEGIGYSFKNIMEKNGVFERCRSVIIVGGGTKSELWLSTLVDALGKESIVPRYCDAAYGAALMAAEASGLGRASGMRETNRKLSRVISPKPENTAYYNEQFPKFLRIAESGLN